MWRRGDAGPLGIAAYYQMRERTNGNGLGRDESQPTKVLIVDDEATARKTMVDLLEVNGYETIAVQKGEEVFQWIGKIDLVLLDAMLPGRDGWSICREIKEVHDPFLPVIMVTARSATADMARTFEAYADDYVTKPFQPAELMARIESRLRVRRLEQELQDLAVQNYELYQQAAKHAAEKEALLRELDHRVRNNLAIITGLASLERCRRPARSACDALASLENRFRVFLLAYDILNQETTRSAPIRKIVDPVLQRLRNMALMQKAIEIEVRGNAGDLDERQALALALILHELVGNAIEHAFPGMKGGKITLDIEEDDEEIELTITDDGIGFAPLESPEVLASGHSIVRALAHGNLMGRVAYESGPGGTTVKINFPRILPDLPTSDLELSHLAG